MEVKQITNATALKSFIEFPYRLYKDEKNWVPPLLISQHTLFDFKKNPFWGLCDHVFFLAFDKQKVVGRIAALVHHDYFKVNESSTGFFGFLEAVNDQKVFKALLEKAEEWLRQKQCKKIIGPVNPSINYEMGTLVEGFDLKPYLMMTYNFTYYPQQLEKLGYSKEMDFFAYYTGKHAPTLSAKMDKAIALTKKRYSINVRNVRKKDFYTELRILHAIYNDAFSEHYGFVPMSLEEFEYMGKDLAQIVDEDLLLIAEYKGEPVGFILALPNYNQVFEKIRNGRLFPLGWLKLLYLKNSIDSVRILTIAIKQKYRHLGMGAYLYKEIINKSQQKNILHGEMSWVAENNVQMNKAAVEMGARVNKRYRLYKKVF